MPGTELPVSCKANKSALCLRSMETYSGWKKILSKSKILALGENGGGRKAASLGLRVHKGTSVHGTEQRINSTVASFNFFFFLCKFSLELVNNLLAD